MTEKPIEQKTIENLESMETKPKESFRTWLIYPDAPKITPAQAAVFLVHHLSLAAMYWECCDKEEFIFPQELPEPAHKVWLEKMKSIYENFEKE